MSKKFVSSTEVYELLYPEDWILEIEEGESDTIMFFKPDDGIGTLRFTTITIRGKNPNTASIIKDLKNLYAHVKFSKKRDMSYLRYVQETSQEGIPLLLYWWHIAKNNRLVLSSFTLPQKDAKSERARRELKIANNVIKSLEILK